MKRLLLLVLVALLAGAWFWFDAGQYLQLAYLKARQEELQQLFANRPLLVGGLFFAVYVAVTGLSLPGATILTLAGGAFLGLGWGVLIISFASSIGATIAMLVARFLLRDWVQGRFGQRLQAINQGIERDGAFYLFGLRLVPVFPFFLINLLLGLTPMRALTYYLVSQAGMLPATFVYVNAGTQIGQLDSLAGILSPALLGSFVLLALFPLLARWLLRMLESRKALRGFTRPAKFDRNLVVIGAGSAGLVSAYIAATVKARVTLVEKARMGGDCLNTGCVPSKALIESTRLLARIRRAGEFGLTASGEADFTAVMQRVREVIKAIEPHDSVERYTALGVECLAGEARIRSPWSVEVRTGDATTTLTTRNIIIATGGEPLVPPIDGLQPKDYVTSDSLWDLQQLPARFVVLGGGPIGCELAQCFARLGSRVTIVERDDRLLPREDADAAGELEQQLRDEGIVLRTGTSAVRVQGPEAERVLVCEGSEGTREVPFDCLLIAVGRRANTRGLGLAELGIETRRDGTLETSALLQTRVPTIYACGDVAGPYQFTHTAAHQAWYATVNSLFGRFWRFKADYRVVPRATFTEPELAQVGLNEQEARSRDIAFEVSRYSLSELDRAIAGGNTRGFVKVLTAPGKDRVLGATIVGEHAGELIGEFVSAMRGGYGLNRILATIHAYPTLAEANKFAAGKWKQAHAPTRLLRWAGRYQDWMRR